MELESTEIYQRFASLASWLVKRTVTKAKAGKTKAAVHINYILLT